MKLEHLRIFFCNFQLHSSGEIVEIQQIYLETLQIRYKKRFINISDIFVAHLQVTYMTL